MKKQPTEWTKILAMVTIQQEINIQNIQRTHDATSVKQTKQFKNGQKTKVDKRRHTYESRHEKMLISHEKIKATMRSNLTLIRMVIINKTTNKCWRGCVEK